MREHYKIESDHPSRYTVYERAGSWGWKVLLTFQSKAAAFKYIEENKAYEPKVWNFDKYGKEVFDYV